MKKILLISFIVVLGFSAVNAREVNAVLNDGTAVSGDLAGKTADSVIILSGGKAKEIELSKLKYVFDKKTGEQIDLGKPVSQTGQNETKESAAQNQTFLAKTYGGAEKARPQQERPVSVASGSITEQVNYFERTGGRYIIIDINMISVRFYSNYASSLSDYESYGPRDTGDTCPTCENIPGFFDGAVGSGLGLLIRPFDFFAFGGYVDWEYSFPPYSAGKNAAVLDFPAGSYGASLRFIPFSVEDTENYEFYFYIQTNIGRRGLNNLFDEAAKYESGVWKTLSGSAPETAFILGIGGIMDLKFGYVMCKMTDIKDSDGNIVKTPAGNPLSVDFGGFYTSFGLSINF